MASTPVIIHTRGLEKYYGDYAAVKSLDLDVHQGEVFGLLGPNGAGKTTTILMLLGLTEPTAGTAEVVGLDPARNPLQVKRHVGYLPDNVGFYGSLSGRENLRYTARLNVIPRDVAEDRITDLLERVSLDEAGDKPVETYSRGMKQRLGLADVLVKEPAVMILDEPTTSIDPVGVAEVLELVRSLAHDQGVAVLISSHLLYQMQQVCDRIAIFARGEVRLQGTLEELAAQQATGVRRAIEMAAEGPREDVLRTLKAVPGVETVEPDARDPRVWVVTGVPTVGTDAMQALIAAGYTPWLMRDRGMNLDEIYQQYFTASAAADAAAAAQEAVA